MLKDASAILIWIAGSIFNDTFTVYCNISTEVMHVIRINDYYINIFDEKSNPKSKIGKPLFVRVAFAWPLRPYILLALLGCLFGFLALLWKET